VNASGPISGNSRFLPKVRFTPEIARMTKVIAVIQWMKRSKPVKRVIVRPDFPLDSLIMPRTA
jgi:hypothetical protein